MQHDPIVCEDCLSAQAELRQMFGSALGDVMRATQLPPMTVMEIAAEMVGVVYGEIAAAHRGPGSCPCGWRPTPDKDIATMQTALARTIAPRSATDLRDMMAAGRA